MFLRYQFDIFELHVVDDQWFGMMTCVRRPFNPKDVDLFFQTCKTHEMLTGLIEKIGVVRAGVAIYELVLARGVGFKREIVRAVDGQICIAFPLVWHLPITRCIQGIDKRSIFSCCNLPCRRSTRSECSIGNQGLLDQLYIIRRVFQLRVPFFHRVDKMIPHWSFQTIRARSAVVPAHKPL